jgi:ligand-binding sensor domain-containing protein
MKFISLLIILLVTQTPWAQEFYFRQAPQFNEGDVRQISVLFQSSDHMVWLGTDKGLYSFDGRKYRYEPRLDQAQVKISALSEDGKGRIWAGYEDGYLQVSTLHGYQQVIAADSLSGSVITKILHGPDEVTMVTTYGKGIWILEASQLSRLRNNELETIDDVYDALFDHQGRLWLATDNGIWRYTPSTSALAHLGLREGLPDEIVTRLVLDASGKVWIGLYDHGLAACLVGRDSVFSLMALPSAYGNITGMANGNPGEIWIGTTRNIVHYGPGNKSTIVSLPAELNQRVESLLYDRGGNLWVAAGNKIFIANTRFEYYKPSLKGIQAIALTDDYIWLGSETGLYGMSRSDYSLRPYLQKEKLNVLSLYTDAQHNLWVGTFGQGLYCVNTVSHKVVRLTEKEGLSNNSILNIDGHDQRLWLATLGGITELEWQGNPLGSRITVSGFFDKFNFPAGYVYDVYAAADGKTWFGTDGKGLYVLEGNTFKAFASPVDTSGEEKKLKTIYSVTAGGDNSIWISGAQGKILQLDKSGKMLREFSGSQGMIHSLVTSGDGDVLMIREGGIQILDRWGDLSLYDENAGLNSFAPNINAVAADTDGSVWIADASQVLHYTSFVEDTGQYVRMHFEAISPGSLWVSEEARLRPDSNFLDVRFTGLWYQDPGNVRYRYMLEGHDQDWIYTQERRAVYSRLSPGRYTFVVEGAHSDDFSGAKSLRKTFVVMPPFYLRWWFVLSASLILSAVVFSYIKARLNRIRNLHKLEKEKTMLRLHALQAQVNPHFLFNSFNTLSGIIEEDQDAAVDYVDHLSGFFRGVLMHRNAELIRLDEEIEIARYYIYLLQKRYTTNLRINENITDSSGWIAPLSIQLLIENAIKHNIVSADKPLTISLTIDGRWIEVSNPVQPKVNASTESTGFGLSSLVTRYQYLTQEKIEIRKEQNTFTVRIPIIDNDKPV